MYVHYNAHYNSIIFTLRLQEEKVKILATLSAATTKFQVVSLSWDNTNQSLVINACLHCVLTIYNGLAVSALRNQCSQIKLQDTFLSDSSQQL